MMKYRAREKKGAGGGGLKEKTTQKERGGRPGGRERHRPWETEREWNGGGGFAFGWFGRFKMI